MRVRNTMFVVGAAIATAATQMQAQCSTSTADACRKTKDMFNFFTPQISTALAGGSTTLGQGGVLGGLGHFAVAVRASAVNGTIPKVDNVAFSTTGERPAAYSGEDQFVPMLSLDGSIGLFKGLPLGVTNVGGIDALITATYLPDPGTDNSGDAQITLPGGSTKFGYGLRVGLLQESIVVPGVSFSFIRRDLPEISISGRSDVSADGGNAPGDFAINNLALKTSSWRISASKGFGPFGLQAGFGGDKYDNSAGVRVTVEAPAPVGTQTASTTVENSMNRTNMYVGASLGFFIGKLVAEYGKVSGGSLPAAINTFGSDADASRSYFSVGIRFGR